MEEEKTVTISVDKEDAAFVLGRGGSTKKKIARVSGAKIELDEVELKIAISGSEEQCQYAQDYISFVSQQRVGHVKIDGSSRSDFTRFRVPSDCIGFVMGRNGQTLRSIEEEWGVLMFFAKTEENEEHEDLCIFGPLSSRRGAELKTMSAVEHKRPGFCVQEGDLKPIERTQGDVDDEDWGLETQLLSEENFSYALGSQGSTRRKLAAAACCVVEYVGRVACFAGYSQDRARAQEYLGWLLEQRTGQSHVQDPENRNDCTVVRVPVSSVAFLTGHRGESLRHIERESSTFCFTDGDRTKTEGDENLLIFSAKASRRERAAELVAQRVRDHKRGGGAAAPSYHNKRSLEACWDYQRGRCSRGESCRFSHDTSRDRDERSRRRERSRDRSRDFNDNRRSRSRDRRRRRDRSRDRSRDRRSPRRRRRRHYSDDSDDGYSSNGNGYRRRRR